MSTMIKIIEDMFCRGCGLKEAKVVHKDKKVVLRWCESCGTLMEHPRMGSDYQGEKPTVVGMPALVKAEKVRIALTQK